MAKNNFIKAGMPDKAKEIDDLIKKLSNNYKQAYNLVKHLRNEKLLILLDKISYESKRFHTYLNDRTIEYPPAYWSSLTLHDFQIS